MKRTLSLLLVFIAALAVQVRPAAAASAVVGTGTPGSCTEAAFNTALGAVQAGGGGVVTFNCGGAATIVFSNEKVIKVDEVIVEGDGKITLSGGSVTRLFRVDTGGRLTLRNTVLTDGNGSGGHGGAVRVQANGTLIVESSTIRNSVANGWAGGAIIDFSGTVRLVDSIIENNRSTYGALNSTGSLTLIRTTVISNTAGVGGGGLSVGGDVVIEDSTIRGNSAPIGGALYVTAAGDVTITGSTFADNQADGTIVEETGGGAIVNDGQLRITHSTFSGNRSSGSGGAVQNGYQVDDAFLFMQGVTLWGNEAVLHGGAVYNQQGVMSVVNSTINDNRAQAGGGVSSFLGPTTLLHVTASANQGGNLQQIAEPGRQDSRQRINLSNTAAALRPPDLDEFGLVPALREYLHRVQPKGTTILLDAAAGLPNLSAAVEVATYRIVQEAVNNAVKHAAAQRIAVTICTECAATQGAVLTVCVEDDGAGLPANPGAGIGLRSMRERAAELGGSCVIANSANGGVAVLARLPLPPEELSGESSATR